MAFWDDFDTTKVDTPENRRGVHRLLHEYLHDDWLDPEDEDTVIIHLRILAEQFDKNISSPDALDDALAVLAKDTHNTSNFVSVFNRFRFVNLIYFTEKPGKNSRILAAVNESNGRKQYVTPVYTQRKRILLNELKPYPSYTGNIYMILDMCDRAHLGGIVINSVTGDDGMFFDINNIKGCISEYEKIDQFWRRLRHSGVAGEFLFPLYAQEFARKAVHCEYNGGNDVVVGYANPCEVDGEPGFRIASSRGKAVIPLSKITFIREQGR